MGSGHGWSGAQTLFWNVVASAMQNYNGKLTIESPPGAWNWCVGCIAESTVGGGSWDSTGMHVFPASLYEAQLAARLGSTYYE